MSGFTGIYIYIWNCPINCFSVVWEQITGSWLAAWLVGECCLEGQLASWPAYWLLAASQSADCRPELSGSLLSSNLLAGPGPTGWALLVAPTSSVAGLFTEFLFLPGLGCSPNSFASGVFPGSGCFCDTIIQNGSVAGCSCGSGWLPGCPPAGSRLAGCLAGRSARRAVGRWRAGSNIASLPGWTVGWPAGQLAVWPIDGPAAGCQPVWAGIRLLL